MRKGKGIVNGGSGGMPPKPQESAPPHPSTSLLKKSSSHRRMVTKGSVVAAAAATTEECSSERSKSESGWHTFIQNKDWMTLQRYLELVASPPIPQLPRERHSNASIATNSQHQQTRNSSYSKRGSSSSKNPPSTSRDSTSSSGGGGGSKKRRSSSLNWLKRSVASMGNMSGRTHTGRLSSSGDSHQQQQSESAIEEQDDEGEEAASAADDYHSGPDLVHLQDKASLLVSNAAGRTPLQLALNSPDAPDHLILHLLRAQTRAVSVADTKGRYPLHFAVVRKRNMETIAELVELFPDAMHKKDQKGKDPVSYAIEVAKRQTNLENAPRTFWATPPSPSEESGPETTWQSTQHQLWEMARWLLQTSACLHHYNNHAPQQQQQQQQFSASSLPIVDHQNPFLIKDGARSQQHILIEAMLHAAPPPVVALLVEATSEIFNMEMPDTSDDDDDEDVDEHQQRREEWEQAIVALGCSAFYLAIFRQYPLEILKRLGSLLENHKEVKAVRDETGLGLVSAHYVTSCFEKSKLLEYVAEEDFMVTMEQCIVEGQLPEDNIPFLEWWDKLKYLIFFCADKNPEKTSDDYLLHAALENTDTPPNVIRLLLALFPGSARQPDAQSAHPLHLFAKHRDYIPRNYESPYMHGLNVMDMLLSLDESAVFHNFQKRLPLHHAIASGRTWSTIHPIISSYRSSLRMPDPITKLYPCQLAAAYKEENVDEETTRLLQLTRNQYSAIVWQGLSQKQQINAVERIRQFESLKRLDTIFELFRRYPQCVETAIDTTSRQSKKKKKEPEKDITPAKEESKPTKVEKEKRSRKEREDAAGPEMITFHYLSWCYKKVGGVWQVVPENMEVLQSSIQVATEHRVLSQKSADFVNWWGMLKMYFWHCYNAMNLPEKPTIPKDDNFLLHVGVSIPTTPPDLIELILGLYPESASLPLPHTGMFPLHLACKTTTYTPQYFEVVERPATVELVLGEFPEAAFARSSSGQTPLHLAIQSGKTMDELRPLIEQSPTVLSSRDPLSGLYAYQLMALSKPLSSDLRLRFRTLAANRHSSEWSKFTGQRKMKEIRTVEKEYQMTVLDSTFELLRLVPSVISSSEVPAAGKGVHPSKRSAMKSSSPKSSGSNSLMGLESRNASQDPIPAASSRARKRGLRRLASGLSRESSVGGGSAFSTIDMMSTISNVSSHLSLRRASSMSAGRLSKGSVSALGEERNDDESEDSDIWSEDASFHHEDDRQSAGYEVEKEIQKNHAGSNRDQTSLSEPRKNVRQQKMKSKWEAPAHFSVEDSIAETKPVDRSSIPKVIVEPSDVEDDVSYLDNINPRSRSGRANSSLRKRLMGDSFSSDDEEAIIWSESNRDSGVTPEDLKAHPEPSMVSDNNVGHRRRSTIPIEKSDSKESEDEEANSIVSEQSEDDARKDPTIATKAENANDVPDDGDNDDDSIHDEIVSSSGPSSKAGEADEPVVVFRIRKTSCQRPGGATRSKVRSESLGGMGQSEKDMDFLSILNASLPEGKMDFLSTLGVSSDNLPPVSDSMPTGMDAKMKFDRMARIQEFPNDSEHSSLQERRASLSEFAPHQAKSPHAAKRDSESFSPKAPNSRRRASQIIPKGLKPVELESCLNCEIRSREVIVLPCGHLCICRNCAIEEDIRSCLICFGPVTDKKVQQKR